MTPSELYERCNETELYQIASASGLSVAPSMSKGHLIACIVGEELPPKEAHEFDEWRLAIMGFVIEHRKRLEVQLRCPAKSMDPRACFQCVDHQVSSCLVENKQNLHLIRIHKKPIEKPSSEGAIMGTNTALNAENAPRDKEKLKAAGSFQLRKLADALGMLPGMPEQMAFGKLLPDERVDEILKRLAEVDGKGGAPAASSAPQTPPPSTTAEQPGTSVAAVDPGAFKAAQDATAPGPGVASAGRRQPKEATTNGVGPATGETAALLSAMQALSLATGTQATLLQDLKGLTAGIDSKVQAIATALAAASAEQTKILKYALVAILTVAEERGVASRFEILQDAVTEASNLDAMLIEITGAAKQAGKAA